MLAQINLASMYWSQKHKNKKIHKINNISNPIVHLNPDFIHSFAKQDKQVQAWEYVYLVNNQEMSKYRISKNQLKHVDITHEILLNEIMTVYVPFICANKKVAKQVKPLVSFERLESFAKRLNLVTIVEFYDKLGNKYEFAMRLVYKKGK